MGIVSSLGVGIESFQDGLFTGRSHFKQLNYDVLSFPVITAAIAELNFKEIIDKCHNRENYKTLVKIGQTAPHHIQVALLASLEAYKNAQAFQLDPQRTSIIVAAQNATSGFQYRTLEANKNSLEYLSPKYAIQYMDFDYVGSISAAFGLRGEGYTIGGASASGNVALLEACRLLNTTSQEACLVVGAKADLSPLDLQAFHNIGALGGTQHSDSPNSSCRPFDRDHDGFILGEATACMILETIESAINRGATIFGYLLGGAICLDGNFLSNPSLEGEVMVMRKAIEDTNTPLEKINYINTHGTSSPLGDETEAKAIEQFFGKHIYNIAINATKSITGHCLWSAGVVEAIATVIQMREKLLHPTLNLHNPINSNLNFVRGVSTSFQPAIALSNSFGFGGINTTLIFTTEREFTQSNL